MQLDRLAVLSFSFIALGALAHGQATLRWRRVYNDPAHPGSADSILASAVASNGDVYWVGDHATFTTTGGIDLRSTLNKNSAQGALLWSVGLTPALDTRIKQVLLDPSGDVVLIGVVGVYYNYPDVIVAKFAPNGTLRWQRQFGGVFNDYDTGIGSVDAAGNISIVGNFQYGSIFSELFVRVYDPLGNLLSHNGINGPAANADVLHAMAALPGGDFAIAGESANGGFVARFTSAGTLAWIDVTPTPDPNWSLPFHRLAVDSSGRIAATGYRAVPGTGYVVGLLKVFDVNGAPLLTRTLGGAFGGNAHAVEFASDDSLWFAGAARLNNQGDTDCVIEHFDTSLALLGSNTYDTQSNYDGVRRVIPGENGEAWVLAGDSQLLECNSTAGVSWAQALTQPGAGEVLYSLQRVAPGSGAFVGTGSVDVSGSGNDYDALLERFDVTVFPHSYCTAGTSANGCSATLSASALPSASAATACTLTVGGVDGQRAGVIFYGLAQTALPWCSTGAGASFLCVKAPTMRTGARSSGGTSGACDGQLTLDWNAFHAAHPYALGAPWQAGDIVYVQGWFRDALACKSTAMSDALALKLVP
ncbi:MAG: hypothetical protein IT454_07665 [Planctomycetes bacterium]|nr:hypothetical protein [Planctomycetota bacterium]